MNKNRIENEIYKTLAIKLEGLEHDGLLKANAHHVSQELSGLINLLISGLILDKEKDLMLIQATHIIKNLDLLIRENIVTWKERSYPAHQKAREFIESVELSK
jgi:hypothetical protein